MKIEELKSLCNSVTDNKHWDADVKAMAKITIAALAHYEAMQVDENGMRYESGLGDYGAYFHDTENFKDLTLEEVLTLLNNTRSTNPVLDAVREVLEGE